MKTVLFVPGFKQSLTDRDYQSEMSKLLAKAGIIRVHVPDTILLANL
ncbi:MAG TPA: hypothetical protein VNG90_03995 [Candidatus Acidoferrum sp.]|nr:hypothetical protein [Candidatus Acidoferrum sp.]